MLLKIWEDRRSWMGYAIIVIALHIMGIVGLYTISRHEPAFLSIGFIAYTLGLRHAFDVDHIAAIDNTVRKLVQQRRDPMGVGFYFSLGHSSVVFLLVLAIAFSVHWIRQKMPEMQEIGGVIGMTVSGSFLIIIGIFNLIILLNLFKMYRRIRSGETKIEEVEQQLLFNGGFLSRLFKPLFKFINRSWHVYPLGFLFGLGFDTATEVGLLAISASAASKSVTIFGILSFPLLFAAGMSLMDTADGMFMTKAYRWAFSTPMRKLYYNFTVTSVSVAAALMIGLVELSQILSEKLQFEGAFWQWVQRVDFGHLGFGLAALFVIAWLTTAVVGKLSRLNKGADEA